ncbi:MFS transporter [Propionigenium maris DSM 9537]|uniref:MFS transporter n=1 Tax=Propionigenium maris DSM 9537 TaxID=1123000 RepID=A0A9W6GLQ6_9FUSO|nr:MFS transporter [Propionigenium maris]GLI57414.1 MFS transporter [Propionigenium maris DSM 9537]
MKVYKLFSAWYFFIFFSFGSFLPLLSPFLKERGFSGLNIGSALALGALVTIIMQPLWGYLADRYRNSKVIVFILITCYTLAGLTMAAGTGVAKLTIIYGVFMVFFSGIMPVIDSMVVGNDLEFGKVRLWGAMGFALGAQLTGLLAENLGLSSIFIAITLSNILVLILTARIDDRSHSKTREDSLNRGDILELLSDKGYLIFLVASFLVGGSMTGHNNYFSLLYRELGGSLSGVGLAFLLFAGSEAPVMALVQNLSRRINVTSGLIISSLIFSIRWLWYSTMPDPKWILTLFFIQGLSIGSFLVLVTLYISEVTGPGLRTTALAIYFSFSAGLGGMFAQYFSGLILNNYGIAQVYSFYFIMSLLGGGLYFLLLIGREKKVDCKMEDAGVKYK